MRIGSREFGKFGGWLAFLQQGGSKKKRRKTKEKIFCQVIYSVEKSVWKVLLHSGKYLDHKSSTLKCEGDGGPLLKLSGA
eukprot:2974549-Ditylum_brightwellii.AAC.1